MMLNEKVYHSSIYWLAFSIKFSVLRSGLEESKCEITLCIGNTHVLKLFSFDPIITKTYLYNFDPLEPHFYIVKLGFTGVYIIFLVSAQKHRLWVLVRTASPYP